MEEARKIYDEIVDLFARGATSAEVLAFSPSEKTQERVVGRDEKARIIG